MRWAALALLAIAGCSAAPLREGRSAQPAPHQATIVSLNPCSDAILAEVADPQQLLAISHYSHDPAATSMELASARRFRAVGGSVEEVLALQPDVVVGSSFMAPATAEAMTRLGLRLERLDIASTVAASKAQVRKLAALAGHPERGDALVRRIDAALAQAAPPPGPPVQTIVWQSGGMVPGPQTLIAELLARTGFANAAAARGLGQADLLPLEQMLADLPQLILAVGNPRANEDRMLSHPALAALRQTGHEPLDPALLYCGGPTIIRAAERLREIRARLGARTLSKGARNTGPKS